jgi:metallo-beta-lactamase family protein
MALAALGIYRAAIARGSDEIRPGFSGDGDPFDPGRLIEAHSTAESRAINDQRFPCVIVSASGMATGGRVLHHLANRLPDPRNTVLLPGFQAAGTRGRSLLEGAKLLKLLGRYVTVRAEVVSVPAFSVHADRDELLAWLRSAEAPPEVVYVVHGEPEASEALCHAISRELGWTAVQPRDGECVRLH